MLKKSIFAIAALSLLLPFTLSAQTGENLYVQKNIDYNYETMSGTLSIESYLKGEVTSSGKPLDIVLVLDASGSMGWEYRGQTNVVYKDQLPKKTGAGGPWYGWKGSDLSGFSVGALTALPEFDFETGYLLKYKDQYYPVYIQNYRFDVHDNLQVYFLKDGGRYYLTGTKEDYSEMTDERIQAILDKGPEAAREPKTQGVRETDLILFNRPLYYLSEETISKMDKLKESVKSFIDLISEDATSKNLDHKISIVQFASGYKSDNHLSVSDYKTSFTQLIKDFTLTTGAATGMFADKTPYATQLKNAIDGLVAKGATSADYGMTIAKELISSKARASDESEKVVIMFTDGEPNHHSNFDKTVANNTISISNGLKEGTTTNDKGKVRVYSVGLFSDLTSKQMANVNPFMNGVSSNYPYATAYTSLGTGSNLGYYQDASDASSNDLSTVFARIASEIQNISSLDSHTMVKDVINTAFTLPSGITADGIKIYTAPLSSISGTEYTFGTKTEITGNDKDFYGISVTTGDNPSVEVSGFDYKENWCGQSGGSIRGKKLIIELPFQLKPTKTLMDSYKVSTNKDESGVYKENETTPIKKIEGFIPFKSLTINMTGLIEGESAIIKLVKTPASGTGIEVNRITLTGINDNGAMVSYTVPFLDPTATYTATQETWIWTYGKTENKNWNYGNSTESQTKNMKTETGNNVEMNFTNIRAKDEKIPKSSEAILNF